MAQSSVATKAVSTIQECVAELKKIFFTEHSFINDDNPALHRLEEKLELVLSVGLKEKPGVFGGKKSYWEYFSACLSSSKRSLHSIKFVKAIPELKTSLGRGRAFIRLCLMQNCLADTLQSCFVDRKTTREYYSELCIPLLPKLWSTLVAHLYDLNEIRFDLNLQHAELDVSWPSFARKLFVSPENEAFSGRNSNIFQLPLADESKTSEALLLIEKDMKECNTLEKELYYKVNEDFKSKEVSENSEKITPTSVYETIKNKCCHQSNNLNESNSTSFLGEKDIFNMQQSTQCVCNCDFKNVQIKSSNDTKSSVFDVGVSCNASKLILEMKELTENLSNNMCKHLKNSNVLSNIPHLKKLIDCLEVVLVSELEKAHEFVVYKQQNENFGHNLKALVLMQNDLIDSLSEKLNISIKKNENLYEKLCSLKDRLHSYGLLKNPININSESSCLPSNDVSPIEFQENINCKIELGDYISSNFLDSIVIFKDSLTKLKNSNSQVMSLQVCLNSSHTLNDYLTTRVQDQEIHMKGIAKELEEAHQLLSAMQKQHQKLQSTENIIKYDLQEKRKLLTRLKQQLESTHEDCKVVRIKNSKTKSEWESLRKEFSLRTKQISDESEFIPNKGLGDQCAVISTSTPCDESVTKVISNFEVCKDISDTENKYILKKNRLQMLEEQCKVLCSNLVNSSKKRQEIDCRLESWCKAIEKSHISEPEKLSDVPDVHINIENINVVSKTIADSNNHIEDSLFSSQISNKSSDCICTQSSSQEIKDICFPLKPLKNESLPIPTSLEAIKNETLLEDTNHMAVFESKPFEVCNATNNENINILVGTSSCSSITESIQCNDDTSSNEANLCNYNLMELKRTLSFTKRKSSELETEVLKLHEEKSALEVKVHELEKTSIMLSSQLALKTQQLKLTETSKEQEITALQFQLNSEILRYEAALKEFTVNNDELNDMKQKITDQEELILTLEEALSEFQLERESDKGHRWEQLQDIQLALVTREEECILLSANLEKLENFKKDCLNDQEMMSNEIINLKDDAKKLQKRIIQLLKEKDILWQRNDHLTHLQKIQIDDRWMNDSEVSKCLGCNSTFSFLLRKHHCRQCGRIFCYSCSNNWLTTASCKNQIRVCNECYKQRLEIKKVVRRNSNVQCCEDSDDENTADNESLSLHKRYMLENCPSIAESIVSLPVMQETYPAPICRFTSVPQLYMSDEKQTPETNFLNDDILSNHSETSSIEMNEDLLINAGEEVEIPFLNEGNIKSLHWKLTPNEAIPILLIYKNSNTDFQETVVHQSACEKFGVIHLAIPGLYKLRFDNKSRSSSISLNYKLKTTSS